MAYSRPHSLSMKNNASFGASSVPHARAQSNNFIHKTAFVECLVLELSNPDLRENALHALSIASKKTDLFPELAPLLWNSFGTIAALLQEIISIYPVLSPPKLTAAQSTRVCHVLALLRCLASHPDTKMPFLIAQIPLYLYPFIKTRSELGQFENLRLASLGVIGASVQVATFIFRKILFDNVGVRYVCATEERFFAVVRVLNIMLASQPPPRLFNLIIPCTFRLFDNRGLIEQKATPVSKLNVPIKTTISANVLEEALNGTVTVKTPSNWF